MYTITTRTGETVEYLDVADTARLVRKALAKSFPATKFYVRSHSYAGGASIDVYYDGIESEHFDPNLRKHVVELRPDAPAAKDVESVAGAFAGGDFDGMIDLAYSVYRYLTVDGEVVGTRTSGTVGSAGVHPPVETGPVPGAKLVRFGADYVFVNAHLPYDVRTKKEGDPK